MILARLRDAWTLLQRDRRLRQELHFGFNLIHRLQFHGSKSLESIGIRQDRSPYPATQVCPRRRIAIDPLIQIKSDGLRPRHNSRDPQHILTNGAFVRGKFFDQCRRRFGDDRRFFGVLDDRFGKSFVDRAARQHFARGRAPKTSARIRDRQIITASVARDIAFIFLS